MKKFLITTICSLFSLNSFCSELATSFPPVSSSEIKNIDTIINNTGFTEKYSISSNDPQTLRINYFFDLTRDNTSVPLPNYWKLYLNKTPSCVSDYNLSLINIKTNKTINFSIPHEKGFFLSCISSFNSNLYYVDFISDKYIILHISGYLLLVDLEKSVIKEPIIKTGYDSVNLIPYNNQWVISVLKHGYGKSYYLYSSEKSPIFIDFSKEKINLLSNIYKNWKKITSSYYQANKIDFKNYNTPEEFNQFYIKDGIK